MDGQVAIYQLMNVNKTKRLPFSFVFAKDKQMNVTILQGGLTLS